MEKQKLQCQESRQQELQKKLEAPMVQLRYAYAIDVIRAKLRMINAGLTEPPAGDPQYVFKNQVGGQRCQKAVQKGTGSDLQDRGQQSERHCGNPGGLLFL